MLLEILFSRDMRHCTGLLCLHILHVIYVHDEFMNNNLNSIVENKSGFWYDS